MRIIHFIVIHKAYTLFFSVVAREALVCSQANLFTCHYRIYATNFHVIQENSKAYMHISGSQTLSGPKHIAYVLTCQKHLICYFHQSTPNNMTTSKYSHRSCIHFCIAMTLVFASSCQHFRLR